MGKYALTYRYLREGQYTPWNHNLNELNIEFCQEIKDSLAKHYVSKPYDNKQDAACHAYYMFGSFKDVGPWVEGRRPIYQTDKDPYFQFKIVDVTIAVGIDPDTDPKLEQSREWYVGIREVLGEP